MHVDLGLCANVSRGGSHQNVKCSRFQHECVGLYVPVRPVFDGHGKGYRLFLPRAEVDSPEGPKLLDRLSHAAFLLMHVDLYHLVPTAPTRVPDFCGRHQSVISAQLFGQNLEVVVDKRGVAKSGAKGVQSIAP